jgi:hypothetical protein
MMQTYNDSSRKEDLKGGRMKNWIKGAIKRPGAFTAKAKKAGKTIASFASSVFKKGSKATVATKKQAVLAKTLRKISKKK